MLGTETASRAYGILPEDRDRFYDSRSADSHVRDLVLRIRHPDGQVRH